MTDQARQMQSINYKKMTIGFNTTTPTAYMRVQSQDNNNQSHQPTARTFTSWEDERVPVPGLNLQIDGDHSLQTTAEKWAQSDANEKIVSSNSALAQSTMDQCRANAIKAPAMSTNVISGFATITHLSFPVGA